MKLPFIDKIWRVKGSLPLGASQSAAEAFDQLDPLFQASGTTHSIDGNTLSFTKKSALAQDKMSIFDHGTLKVEGGVLDYRLSSRPLLFCFLAPLLFLAFSQLTVAVGKWQQPDAATAAKKEAEEKKKAEDKAAAPMNPIDKFLGAPAPDKPKKDDEKKGDKKKDEEKDKGPSPTPAYVFAAIFAVLYLAGRILEPWLIKREFRKRLSGSAFAGAEASPAK